jgi:hypothetical protein
MSRSGVLALVAGVLLVVGGGLGSAATPSPGTTPAPPTTEPLAAPTHGPLATPTAIAPAITELAAMGDPAAAVWVPGYGPGGRQLVHRLDGTTGTYTGSFDASVDGCTWKTAGPVTPLGLWVVGGEPQAGDAPGQDFCGAHFPFDGSPPKVVMQMVKPGNVLLEKGAFAIGEDLWFVGVTLPAQGGRTSVENSTLYHFAPDGTSSTIKGVTSAAGGTDRIWAIRQMGQRSRPVTIDPITGKSRTVRVGGADFAPFSVSAGGGNVIYQGFGFTGASVFVLDERGRQVATISGGRAGGVIPSGFVVDEDSVFAASGGPKGGIFAASATKNGKLKRIAACRDCYPSVLGQVPGAVWYTTWVPESTEPPTMQRFDSMSRSLDVTIAQDPRMPIGFVADVPSVELPPLPEPPAGSTFGSPAFAPGSPIPERFTCDGEDVSPPLEWSDGAAEYAVVVTDPDAGGFVHWIVTGIPAGTTGLPEGASAADGLIEGTNGFGRDRWDGPCPPPGKPHAYEFRLYRLPETLGLTGDVTLTQLHKVAMASGGTVQQFTATFGH